MSWFAAHVVLYVKLKKPPQKRYPAWENIILVRASSEEEAWKKAEKRGREDAGDDGGTFTWGGKPATWVFAGIRKLTECAGLDRPKDGTEISYTEMILDSEDAVRQLVDGEPVCIQFDEVFAD